MDKPESVSALVIRARTLAAEVGAASALRIEDPPRPSDRLRPMFREIADLLDKLAGALAPPVAALCLEEGGCYMFADGTEERKACARACLMLPRHNLTEAAAIGAHREELRDHILQLMTCEPVQVGRRQNLISYAHGYALGLCGDGCASPRFEPLIVAGLLVKLTTELTELSNAKNPTQ